METKLNETQGKEVKLLCAECKRSTNHVVLVSVDNSNSQEMDDGFWVSSLDNYQVVQCKGCDTHSFRHLNWFSEYENPEQGIDGTTERLYPKRNARTIQILELLNVPANIRRIYRESIDSCNNECFTVSAAGLRAVVEGICADQGIKDGPVTDPETNVTKRMNNLHGKINGLVEKGKLTSTSAETLHGHRFLGNGAVHELTQPSYGELKLAIEIIQHTLEQLYEIPIKSEELKEHIKNRGAKRKKGRLPI
jgi:hypothetical protein